MAIKQIAFRVTKFNGDIAIVAPKIGERANHTEMIQLVQAQQGRPFSLDENCPPDEYPEMSPLSLESAVWV